MKAGDVERKPRDICERTFEFALRTIRVCRILEDDGGVGRTIGWQLIRSGTSVGANIEEGQGGQSRADFVSKYSIARKEARETLYWLRLLTAAKIVSEDQLRSLMSECNEIIAILTTIIKKTRAKHE